MKILGIETSCDETAASIIENGTTILSNVIASSVEMHAKTGGIIPENAARQQVKSIIPVINQTLKNAKLNCQSIDSLAVTVGPGLIGSLLVGVETAKTLAYIWRKPIIPVNHLVAHIYANFLTQNLNVKSQSYNSKVKTDKSKYLNTEVPTFPALALVVSGGHTDLVLMPNHGKLEWIGGTLDDAAGEAFDKCARLLDLGYPGGPAISAEAEKVLGTRSLGTRKLNLFPRPLVNENAFDWSFSGLKTAVSREILNHKSYILHHKSEISAEIQEAIVDSLVTKTIKAVEKFKPKSLLLAGGVAAKNGIRNQESGIRGKTLHPRCKVLYR